MTYPHGDGWQVVQHGRHGRPRARANHDYRPGGRSPVWRDGASHGMDRAPLVFHSRGGQVQFPFPNRPVPPMGFAPRPPISSRRFVGPQSQSYASVVRQNHTRSAHNDAAVGTGNQRFGQRRQQQHRYFTSNNQERITSSDPKFGQVVRKFHKIIKTVHHLQNVSSKPGNSEPLMISRMVDNLTGMIKPAFPNQKTVDLIWGNAKNWGHTTLIILGDHYKEILDTMLTDLQRDMIPDWRPAFGVAKKWAYKNLPRLKQEVVDHAEALITSCMEVDGETVAQTQRPSHTVLTHTCTTQQTQTESESTGGNPNETSQTVVGQPTGLHASEQTSHETQDEIQGGGSILQPPQQDSPKEQRPRRSLAVQNPCVIPDGDELLQIEEQEQDSSIRETAVPTMAPKQGPQDVRLSQTQTALESMSQISQAQGEASDLGARIFQIQRHISTDRKLVEWGLSVRKKYLIIGDSNLSRFPPYTTLDLQIDSFPGANFRHAQAILAKASTHTTVEKVVLSFGINCRRQKTKETAIKQMQAAVRTSKRVFPYAEIWIPKLNYSTTLPSVERTNLQLLNGHISRNIPFIPPLRNSDFETEADNIHWSKDTAQAMFDHWTTFLNFITP